MRVSRADMLAWAAPIAAVSVVSISLSLTIPLYSLLLEREGASGVVIGLVQTMASVAMVLAAPLLPAVVARTGLVPLMLGAVLLLGVTMPIVPLWHSAWWWGFLRLCWGVGGAILFFASEFWLVAAAPAALRGRLIAIYSIVLAGCYMLGPLILNMTGIDGWPTYAVPTAIILAAGVPIWLGRHSVPLGRHGGSVHLLAPLGYFRSDPLILWGVVLFGMIEFGGMALVTVWGVRTGYAQPDAVALVFWIAFGSMLFQWPIGWAADRFERRRLLALAGVASAGAPLGMVAFSGSYALAALFAVLWGGMAVALYTLALAELGARYSGAVLAEANAAVILAYGIGALVSPSAFGWAMDVVRPDGLLWFAAFAAAAYLALAAARLRIARPRRG